MGKMKPGELLAVAAACACLTAAGPQGLARAPAPFPRTARPQPDAQGLPGTWRAVEVHANGKHLAHEVGREQVWVITTDRIFIRYKDSETEEFTYRIDPTATPKAIDLTPAGGQWRTSSFRGVYEVKGGRLKLCRSRGSRPATLSGDEVERGEVLFVLQRQKR